MTKYGLKAIQQTVTSQQHCLLVYCSGQATDGPFSWDGNPAYTAGSKTVLQ